MILIIDNYDSFSYNLYQMVGSMNSDLQVIRNDEMTVDEIKKLNPKKIIISPGPGKPKDAGICEAVILELGKTIPILGVCLGHQAICECFNAKVSYAKQLMHGKQSKIHITKESELFKGIEKEIDVARYHSLAAVKETIPECLKITSLTEDDEVMSVEHKEYKIYGVQFHPESILTPVGKKILENFVNM